MFPIVEIFVKIKPKKKTWLLTIFCIRNRSETNLLKPVPVVAWSREETDRNNTVKKGKHAKKETETEKYESL